MAYICFNPSKTTPALTNLQPHSGEKLGCCFSSIPPNNPNNKWLITPRMRLGIDPQIEFWVQSYSLTYGYEKYNVAVSVTDLNPSSFVPVNAVPDSAPITWAKRSYDLSKYTNQNVYIGIQCITNDGFIFMLDDISITSTVGLSDKENPDNLIIFPNPAKEQISLSFSNVKPMELKIGMINAMGNEIRSWEVSAPGTLTLDIHDVPRGVYILTIKLGDEYYTRKISVIN